MDEQKRREQQRMWEEVMKEERVYPPIHPGRVLEFEFLEPLGLSAERLAEQTGVPEGLVSGVLRGERPITEMAPELSHRFGNSEQFWRNLQTRYDQEIEEEGVG